MPVKSDPWSRWLLDRRDAGDAAQRLTTLEHLSPIRDRVLEGAGSLDGATLLDVGCGDGLIGLRALDLVGPNGTVIFADISDALIEHCRELVRARGVLERARFVLAGAEDLAGIATASVDVVTARSVLIYVGDKPRAISAMHRVLRPGGRISLFEPGSLMRSVTLDALLGSAPNPNAPTVGEAITAALTEPERQRFVAELEQAVTEDRAVRRMAVAYRAACKRR